MTTQHLSDFGPLVEAQRTRDSRRARLAAAPAVGALASAASDEGRWLTAILRPAGSLDRQALRGLSDSLRHLATSSNMVIVDLTAAVVGKPGAFARDLLAPAREFERAGQCLLLLGASPELTAALDRYAVPVVTLAADALPPQAA
ncbi:MAG TPA: hypothetical protein VHZ33_21660 [Trebonia sp.]|nr:hypothetical protein [Trebonia sp.]